MVVVVEAEVEMGNATTRAGSGKRDDGSGRHGLLPAEGPCSQCPGLAGSCPAGILGEMGNATTRAGSEKRDDGSGRHGLLPVEDPCSQCPGLAGSCTAGILGDPSGVTGGAFMPPLQGTVLLDTLRSQFPGLVSFLVGEPSGVTGGVIMLAWICL